MSRRRGARHSALRAAFDMLADETGAITPVTLRRASYELGLNYTGEEIAEMMELVAGDEDDRVDLNSLVDMIRECSEHFPNLEDVTAACSSFSFWNYTDEVLISRDDSPISPDQIQREVTSVSRGLTTIVDEDEDKNSVPETHTDFEEQQSGAMSDHSGEFDDGDETETDSKPRARGFRKHAHSEELNDGTETDRKSRGFRRHSHHSEKLNDGVDTISKSRSYQRPNDDGSQSPQQEPRATRVQASHVEDPRAVHSRTSHVLEHRLDEGVVTLIKMYDEEEDEDSNLKENKAGPPGFDRQDTNPQGCYETSETTENAVDTNADKTVIKKKRRTRSKSISNNDDRITSLVREVTNTPTEHVHKREPSNRHRARNITVTKRERTDLCPIKRDLSNNSPTKRDLSNNSPIKRAGLTNTSPTRQYNPRFLKNRKGESTSEESPRVTQPPAQRRGDSVGTGGSFTARIGPALKLSQLRMKQRLMYILWRALYDEALKKAEANRKVMLLAKEKKKKTLRRRNSNRSLSREARDFEF